MSDIFIMLVDDEEAFVNTMRKRLEKRKFKVATAFSGYDALEKLKKNQEIDVILLDVKMPGIDGIETLREIKRNNPLTEVIMLTAHATVESAIEGMKLGAFDYLLKPCEISQLIEKVKEGAEKKRKHEEKIREARLREVISDIENRMI